MHVAQALDAIFAAQTPPVSPGQTYALSSLSCVDVQVPLATTGYECSLEVQTDSGQPITVNVSAPSDLAQNLFDALTAAGSTSCGDPHGVHVDLKNVAVSPGEVQFDDTSMYRSLPAPDVIVQGADAQAVITALARAGINDCDPTRRVFVICNSFGGTPNCGYQWLSLQTIGMSELVSSCGPGSGGTSLGATLDAASSAALWESILSAAKAAHFQPMSGTIEQTTTVNARYFTWDGSRLGFTLVTGDATPPGPAADAGKAD